MESPWFRIIFETVRHGHSSVDINISFRYISEYIKIVSSRYVGGAIRKQEEKT